MAKRNFHDLYKEFMSNPHRTPMPGKTKHETAMEEAHKQLLQSYNNDMALTMMPKEIEAQYVQKKKLTKQHEIFSSITKEDISKIAQNIIKQLRDLWGVATTQAKDKYGEDADFAEGSPAREYRDRVVEAIKRDTK